MTHSHTAKEFEIRKDQKIDDARMDDSGEFYFTTFEFRLSGDIELYGDGEWRAGRIIWETTETWKKESEAAAKHYRKEGSEYNSYECQDVNLDDESEACDWGEYTVIDESGDELPWEIKAKISNLI